MTQLLSPSFHPLNALRRRLALSDFASAGIPSPLFFCAANSEDAPRGEIVDIVSGVKAVNVGTPVFSQMHLDTNTLDGVPYPEAVWSVLLGYAAGLSFPGIPQLFPAGTTRVAVYALVRLNSVMDTSFAGAPMDRYRTLVARSFRDPGGSGSSMSGWSLGLRQSKASTGASGYLGVHAHCRVALGPGSAAQAANDTDTTQIYPTGRYSNSTLRSVCFILEKAPSAGGVETLVESPFSSVYRHVWGYTGSAVGLTLEDPADRALTVGCALDAATGTYYTDFLDGDLIALGVWPQGHRVATGAASSQAAGNADMVSILKSIAIAQARRPLFNSYVPRSWYVDTVENSRIMPVPVGETVAPGDVFRTPDRRVYRVLRGGVPTRAKVRSRYADGATLEFTDRNHIGLMPGVPLDVIVEEVTGLDPTTPAATIGVKGVVGGDTIVVGEGYSPASLASIYPSVSDYYGRVVEDTARRMTTRPRHILGMQGPPVVIDFSRWRTDSSVPRLDYALTLSGGAWAVANLSATATRCKLVSRQSRLSIHAATGASLSVDASGVVELHRPTYRAPFCNSPDHHVAIAGTTSADYEAGVVLESGLAYNSANEGVSLSVFGGHLCGSPLDVSDKRGGVHTRMYGVTFSFRGGYQSTNRDSAFYVAGGVETVAPRSSLAIVGGLPGVPANAGKFDMLARSAEFRIVADRLRGGGKLWGRKSYDYSYAGSYYLELPTTKYDHYRNASPARDGGLPYAVMLPSRYHTLDTALTPVIIKRYAASVSAVRLHFAATSGGLAALSPYIRVTYTVAGGKQACVFAHLGTGYTSASESTAGWTSSYAVEAGRVQIDLPGAVSGYVSAAVYCLGNQAPTYVLDPYLEVVS